jgi:hypothetical protein
MGPCRGAGGPDDPLLMADRRVAARHRDRCARGSFSHVVTAAGGYSLQRPSGIVPRPVTVNRVMPVYSVRTGKGRYTTCYGTVPLAPCSALFEYVLHLEPRPCPASHGAGPGVTVTMTRYRDTGLVTVAY